MVMTRTLMVAAGVLVWVSVAQAAEKTVKETMISDGASRTYYLFVPERAKDTPSPLIILLHGSGRDGRILVDHWESLAKKEGIVLAGPDATVRQGWGMRDDGPLFLRHLLEAIQEKHAIDPRRVYIFGHSAGANHGLKMAILESEYFAAVAVHAGALGADIVPFIPRAPRKIPIAIWIGTNDNFFPLKPVRASRDALNEQGFNAELTEINGHTHDYYGSSSEINKGVWAFLKDKHLERDPQYQDYVIPR
jgi:poly(3-hydroxybutyrate) depolymerase